MKEKVVVDTNVLIAAAFNQYSHSARIVKAIEDGQLDLVWNKATRKEAHNLMDQIPPLTWGRIEGLFRRQHEFNGETPGGFALVKDPDDRKFVALASAAGAILISNDDHLLEARRNLEVAIMTPSEFLEHWKEINAHTS